MVKINYVSFSDYRKSVLQKGRKLFSSDSSDFYQVGLNSVLKDYQYHKLPADGDFLLHLLESWKEILIEQSKLTSFEELLKADELWLVDGYLKGIEMPMMPSNMIDFEDYITACKTNMREICEKFSLLNTLFEKGSNLGLVFLDSTTKGNLKMNPNTSSFLFLDGEGIQTKQIFPFTATDFLNLDENRFIMYKYLKEGKKSLYATLDTNRLIILTYFIKLCTRYVWITEHYSGMPPQIAMELVLKEIGLANDEFLAPIIRTIFRRGEIPKIESDRWQEFGRAYTLVPASYGGINEGGYAFKRR